MLISGIKGSVLDYPAPHNKCHAYIYIVLCSTQTLAQIKPQQFNDHIKTPKQQHTNIL